MAGDSVTLYFFPSSYYSLKAYLALQEKGIPFRERIVNTTANEQHQDWYLRINPKGEVPVLQHGTKFIPDSEAIVDFIDEQWSQGPRLVPDVETSLGQEVQELRRLLHDVPIDHISFGIMAHRNFWISKPRVPGFLLRTMSKSAAEKRLRGMLDGLKAAQKTLPEESQEAIAVKIKDSEERLATVLNVEAVAVILDDLEKVFDRIESQLEKSKTETLTEKEYWLCCSKFTVVDITAAVLMYRLYFLGVDERYFSDKKRAIVKNYFDRLLERPAVKKTILMSESGWKYMAGTVIKKALKIGFLIGVVALGVLGARAIYKHKV